MSRVREVALNIGKGVYVVSTSLDGEAMDRVKALIDGACPVGVKGVSQEEVLMLACLRLAYGLDAVNVRMGEILSVMNAE